MNEPVILGSDGEIDWSVTRAYWAERWNAALIEQAQNEEVQERRQSYQQALRQGQ